MNLSASISDSLYVFIMAGGSGERFWPMSRNQLPKHLLRLFGKRTLLEETIDRIKDVVSMERIFILTNQTQIEALRKQLPLFAVDHIIVEPAKRDTGPAAALATAMARAQQPNAIVALLPADAMIRDVATFRRQMNDAIATAARQPCLVTISITPTYPATGFGYLELGAKLYDASNGSAVYQVLHFVEKPDKKTAQTYLQQGKFGWNAGMFVWQAEYFLQECSKLSPPLADFIRAFPTGDPTAYILEYFPHLPKNSVDFAIMENASHVVALRSQFDWDDVGSWTALPTHLGCDSDNNCIRGSTVLVDSKNNIVVANQRTVVLCGIQDLVVVETSDAVLIGHRDALQNIKKIHPLLPEELH